ncbi:YdcF family protein [Paenibacillus paridis]|uniref:YdcF family protein n=1 Tax=Paenibacillus paridis TaxID=2583376 RepID=UPI00111E11ED|nr:YdcF family protein [Paenibacillus paridis]
MLRRLRIGALAAVFILVLYLLYTAYSIVSFADKNERVRSDAAIVLGAAVWGEEPSPVLAERMNHAIWLYNNGYVAKIIATGGIGDGDAISEAEAAKRYAVQKGIPEVDVILEVESRITEQNLEYAYAIARQNHLRTLTIVSDPLHMKRAVHMAKDLGMEAYSSPTQTSVYQSMRTKFPFLLREIFFMVGYQVKMLF